jgi:hypothetical protein
VVKNNGKIRARVKAEREQLVGSRYKMKKIENIWDRKYNLPNRPVLANRDIEVIGKVQELFNVTIGDAISGLMRGDYSYKEILEILREEGHSTI